MPQMPKPPVNVEILEHDVDQGIPETPSHKIGRYRGLVGLVFLALFSYAISLVATAPASLLTRLANVPAAVTSLSGSVWHGQAMLIGGHIARWSVVPLASLSQAALIIQWSLLGPGTQLQGDASLRPNRVSVNDIEGRASWQLVNAILPNLPITCEAEARIVIERAVFSEATKDVAGELRSGPSVCTRVSATPAQAVEVPPLLAVATLTPDGSQIEVTSVADPATPLARVALTARNTLVLTMLPAGARLVPGMPSSGATTLEIPL